MKYYVKNTYGIEGTSTHRTPEAACKAANRREGEGWIVSDKEGNQWSLGWKPIEGTVGWEAKAFISEHAKLYT